jgi:predicted SprT family Zn-dependent metalloprotease
MMTTTITQVQKRAIINTANLITKSVIHIIDKVWGVTISTAILAMMDDGDVQVNARMFKKLARCSYTRTTRRVVIEYSAVVWAGKEHTDAFKEVVLHELGHAIAYLLGGRAEGHNSYWADIVRKLGGNPSKYVKKEEAIEIGYEELYAKIRSKRVTYKVKCACSVVEVGARIINNMKNGAIYRCKDCKQIARPIK